MMDQNIENSFLTANNVSIKAAMGVTKGGQAIGHTNATNVSMHPLVQAV